MTQKKTWVNDVEDLAQQSVEAEISARVWERFEGAVGNLDPHSAAIFNDYLEGMTAQELGKRERLSEEEVRALIHKIKRDVIQKLRQDCKVRQ